MKQLAWLGRSLKSICGWILTVLFGGVGVYALLDETEDGAALVAFCFLLAAFGVLLIRSARRDKKRAEARDEEERQYRRRQEEAAQERARQERRETVTYAAVECPGCGAVAKIRKGGVGRCEYCGTVLEGK